MKERVAIFIDGSNLYHSLKKLGLADKLNFKRLIEELLRKRELVNAHYYIAQLDFKTNPKKYWKHQKFINKLKKIPKFKVILCTCNNCKRGRRFCPNN